ncbi:Aarf domain containing kinase [Thalictrum thalictroides]|uniref:Aarf domain containing kinase n=1 Tax=Thalictrum thalictroides TaxID=46969 RepID=A0A7J6W7B6_THATH|nr:Aarf domain containing kinase [Thalictrum thalictroides]
MGLGSRGSHGTQWKVGTDNTRRRGRPMGQNRAFYCYKPLRKTSLGSTDMDQLTLAEFRKKGQKNVKEEPGMQLWGFISELKHGKGTNGGASGQLGENFGLLSDWQFCLLLFLSALFAFDLGKREPQLVLLDHGLYKELDDETRINYAALWKALVFADAKAIRENSVKLGAGDDLYALFAGILTMRPWNRVIDPAADHLVIQGNNSDRSELQMYASQYFPQISELLRRLPRVILLMLKTNDCLRAVNNCLLQRPSLEHFLIIGRISSEAILERKMLQRKYFFSGLSIWLEEILLEARLLTMQVALWLLSWRKLLSG